MMNGVFLSGSRNRKKGKVLIIGHFLPSGKGSLSAAEDLANLLEAHGWDIHRTSALRYKFLRPLDMLYKIWSQAGNYDVAIVTVFSGPAFLWAEAAATWLRFLKKPFILSLHGGGLPRLIRQTKRIEKLLRSAICVTTPSIYLKNTFYQYRKDILYIPNFISLKRNSVPRTVRLRKDKTMAWLRGFHKVYNPRLAVSVFKKLLPQFPDLKLIMVGPDLGMKNEICHLAKSIKGQGLLVKNAIANHEVAGFLAGADVFINTTNFESFGKCVLEAAVCGTPIVSTNVGEIPYLWKDGEDVLLVPPDDAEAMAAAVRRIFNEPGLAEKLSQNARVKAEQFDQKKILPLWEDLLVKLPKRQIL